MSGPVQVVAEFAVIVSSFLTLLCFYRILKGPTVADKMVGLDTITTNIVAIGVSTALATQKDYFILISVVLAIIGFVSTLTVAMYIDEGDIIV